MATCARLLPQAESLCQIRPDVRRLFGRHRANGGAVKRTIPLGEDAQLTITQHGGGVWTVVRTAVGQPDLRVTLDNDAQAREAITHLLAAAMRPAIDLD